MHRVLVAEKIADPGLDALRAAGHEVDVRIGLSPEELREAIAGVSGLIVRSATQVDAELIAAAGPSLAVVGRAGVGLDNVDTAAATANGVMVVNAPESNITSAAEHTMALLLAQAATFRRRTAPWSTAAGNAPSGKASNSKTRRSALSASVASVASSPIAPLRSA